MMKADDEDFIRNLVCGGSIVRWKKSTAGFAFP
jgi:hypothetical protein